MFIFGPEFFYKYCIFYHMVSFNIVGGENNTVIAR